MVLGRREQRARARTPSSSRCTRSARRPLASAAPITLVVERAVDLGQRVGQAVEVRDAADDRRAVDHVRARRRRRRARSRLAQVAGVDLGRPRGSSPAPRAGRRRAPRSPGRASSRRTIACADHAGAAGDEDAAHARSGAVAARAHLARVGEQLPRAPAVPGVDDQAVGRGAATAICASARGVAERAVVGGDDHGIGVAHRVLERARVGVGTSGSCATTSASSRSSSRTSLCDEAVALVVGVGLEGEAEHADARGPRASPMRRSQPADQEQRHRLVDARDGEQHAGRVRALLGEREVLAQAGAGGEARPGDARRAGSRG